MNDNKTELENLSAQATNSLQISDFDTSGTEIVSSMGFTDNNSDYTDIISEQDTLEDLPIVATLSIKETLDEEDTAEKETEEKETEESEGISKELSEDETFDEDSTSADVSFDAEMIAKEDSETIEGSTLEETFKSVQKDITFIEKDIPISDIILPEFKKIGRSETVVGMSETVKTWGILEPLHVLTLEDEGKYLLIQGLRRLFAARKNNFETVPCRVWILKDKSKGKQLANILSLMLNRTESPTTKEKWAMFQVLEEVNALGFSDIEYLLMLESGQAMKFKDVMSCSDVYIEVRTKMLEGTLTIDAAYKKLCNMRKKANRLEEEDNKAVENNIDGTTEKKPKKKKQLTDEEVKSDLELQLTTEGNPIDTEKYEEMPQEEMSEYIDKINEVHSDISSNTNTVAENPSTEVLSELDRTNEVVGKDLYQQTNARHPLPQAVRQGAFMRDGFKCRCCGMGGSEAYLAVLAAHHAIPVYAGGADTKENTLTLCINCHILLHNYLQGLLRVDYSLLNAAETIRFKNVCKYGNIALDAVKKKNIKMSTLQDLNKASTKHPRPEAYIRDNKTAYNSAVQEGYTATKLKDLTDTQEINTEEDVDKNISEETLSNAETDIDNEVNDFDLDLSMDFDD